MFYLVTGCAGFIGARITAMLLEGGHQVLGVDNMNDYYDVRLKEWRLSQLMPHESFSFNKLDIADYQALALLFRRQQFDGVFNIAARAGVRASVEDPWAYYDTNTRGALNILECCRQHGVKKIVQASTSSVYGNSETPFRVDGDTDRALSPYAASKKAAEVLCHSYYSLYGLDIAIPRYFSVYGPGGRPDMAYFKFMVMIDRGEAIPVFGDGQQARDFTYVDDVASASIRCMELSGYHILNIGNDNPVKLIDLITMIEETLGKKTPYRHLPRHLADNLITWSDISGTRELLGWEPKTSFKEGMRRVLNWYAENRQWVQELNI